MKTYLISFFLLISLSDMRAGGDVLSSDKISSKDIYDFMQMVIKDQKLSRALYLDTVPAYGCNFDDDSTFLSGLITDTALGSKKNSEDTIMVRFSKDGPLVSMPKKISIHMYEFSKCLSGEDVTFMLKQRTALSSFRWDRSRLGFSKKVSYTYYNISVPVFSVDRTKAILMIEELCPGLCGSGYTIVYIKKDGRWTSQKSGTWYH